MKTLQISYSYACDYWIFPIIADAGYWAKSIVTLEFCPVFVLYTTSIPSWLARRSYDPTPKNCGILQQNLNLIECTTKTFLS